MTGMRNALRLIRQGWRSTVALTLLISVGCFVFSLALSDVFTQAAVLRGGRVLRAADAVSFTTFYKEGAVSTPSADALAVVADQLTARTAYTAVINNVDLSGSSSEPGLSIVVLLGDRVLDLYPDLDLCAPTPCAMRGRDAGGDAAPSLEFAGRTIPFSGRLPRRATWFDPSSTGIPLDQRVVVRLEPSDLGRLDAYAQEELISRVVLLKPDAALVDAFVGEVRSRDVYLVPSRLSVDQPRAFREVVARSALYLSGFAAYLLLMFSILSVSLHSLLRRERSRFKIMRISGATERDVGAAVALFLVLSIVVVPVLVCAPLLLLGGSFPDAFLVVTAGCLVVCALEVVRARLSGVTADIGKVQP